MAEVDKEKQKKFMEIAGKRVNNVIHDIQILTPMARSSNYDYSEKNIDLMFRAMEGALAESKAEFIKRFEEKAKKENKTFSFEESDNVENEIDFTNEEDE